MGWKTETETHAFLSLPLFSLHFFLSISSSHYHRHDLITIIFTVGWLYQLVFGSLPPDAIVEVYFDMWGEFVYFVLSSSLFFLFLFLSFPYFFKSMKTDDDEVEIFSLWKGTNRLRDRKKKEVDSGDHELFLRTLLFSSSFLTVQIVIPFFIHSVSLFPSLSLVFFSRFFNPFHFQPSISPRRVLFFLTKLLFPLDSILWIHLRMKICEREEEREWREEKERRKKEKSVF